MLRIIRVALLCLVTSMSLADDTTPREVALAEGELVFTAPMAWKSVEPANRIIEHELAVPAKDGKAEGVARLTIMAAGGSIDANVARWVAQFKSNDNVVQEAKTEKLDVNGMPATLVDLSGTYIDSPRGPFGPKVERPGYRLVGAIVETKEEGVYFFKLIGPEETVATGAEKFREVVGTLRRNDQ